LKEKKMEIVTQRPNGKLRVRWDTGTDSKVEQSHKSKVNINTIVRKINKTGMVPAVHGFNYGNFANVGDYHSVQNRLINANNQFMSLPSDIRNKFDNDVGKLIDFINKPENALEAANMGLIDKNTLIDPKTDEKSPTEPDKAPEPVPPTT
jgi:phage internal scaffolding protein